LSTVFTPIKNLLDPASPLLFQPGVHIIACLPLLHTDVADSRPAAQGSACGHPPRWLQAGGDVVEAHASRCGQGPGLRGTVAQAPLHPRGWHPDGRVPTVLLPPQSAHLVREPWTP